MAQRINKQTKAANAIALTKGDDREWAERCGHWSAIANKRLHRPNKKWDAKVPLILTGNGVSLSIDRGTLVVTNGFTHYPQEREQWRFFPGDRNLPSRIVVLDGRGGLSFQVLAWLSAQAVPLVQVDWQGNVVTVAGSTVRAIDHKLANAQRDAHTNGRGLRLARQLVEAKVINAKETLRKSLPVSPATELAISRLEQDAALLRTAPPNEFDKLRGIEGRVGAAYFRAWQAFPLRWTGTGRTAIPGDWRRIGWRRSHISETNRHAHHPVNAMLNYAYGVLENTVRMHLAGIGFDLSVGVMHSSNESRQPLVYDFMEPLRPVVDRSVLAIVREHKFTPADFTLKRNGVCRLNPQLARAVVRGIDYRADVERLVSCALVACDERGK